ncbi:MAG: hypothetical protein JXO22_02370 [Phycisphaerae bacterium]|nr:hypothetical protein [Phycisphaerae bacterium]
MKRCGKTSFLLAAALLIAMPVNISMADTGDLVKTDILSAANAGVLLDVGSPEASGVVEAVVASAADVSNEFGELLPAGTTVDRVEWVDNLLHIDLTIPPQDAEWYLTDTGMESLGAALGRPFLGDSSFGGTVVRARIGVDRAYGSLEQFGVLRSTPVPVDTVPNEVAATFIESQPVANVTYGPTQQAGRQPTGALSGVVVYASAGHGWTAGNSAWFLQRPVLLDMCEDYGNIDQLNYFVHYAFNAGATVVPMRPVGWQPIEIVLDQDDPGVTYTGAWGDSTYGKYYENGVTNSGVSYRFATASTSETATARYTPTITVSDFYPVYCFTIASDNRALQIYKIGHSGGESRVTIDHRETGNGWIWLGDYYLEAGGDNYVEITNETTEGSNIIADAMRWGGGIGDISRPGPGSISGYPRDEECQRYWGHSEWGNNAVGFDSDIWDGGGSEDQDDNVRTGGKIAREMNQVPAGGILQDRWKRVHLEFHTNASGGTARGQICLITTLGATTYQTEFANILSDEVDNDLLIADADFEHTWLDRSSPTYTSSYGAICTGANDDEFDATIVELAFHDQELDAQLLRDPRVRAAMARACVHGITRFLNSLPDSQVPLAFAPDTPRHVRLEDAGNGDVLISWVAPLSDGARGDPATGYVVYESSNGYGFGTPTVLGNVTSTTISGIAGGETRYFRVAATNAGGESMPTEVLAFRRKPVAQPYSVLIVNGFDRLRRQINPIQNFTQPAGYAGDWIERQIWRRSNEFDYMVQHAEALAADGYGFDSCSNEAVINQSTDVGDYDVVVWICGTEAVDDESFSSTEQSRLITYLGGGGALLVSGAEIGYDLVAQSGGVGFYQDTLRVQYVSDDAGTYDVSAATGGCLNGISAFDFDPASGAVYDTRTPDVIAAGTDAVVCLNYVGGSGGAAGVQFGNGLYNVVTLGFPFETISSATKRNEVMQGIMAFLTSDHGPKPFDYNNDGTVNFTDWTWFRFCFQGPDANYAPGYFCIDVEGVDDMDIDMADFSLLQDVFLEP